MNFIAILQKLSNSSGALWHSAFFTCCAKRLLRLFVLPLLALAAMFTFTGSAMAESAACTAINADWHNRSELTMTANEQYPASSFEPTDTVSFTLTDNRPGLHDGELWLASHSGPTTWYVSYYYGYNIGNAATTISGSQLASNGLVIGFINYTTNDLVVTVTCTSSAAPAPSITGNPSNSTISVGGNSSFTVSASNATTYKWQVSTNGGGSFADISNGGVYSGATTATLNITAATIGMTGYQYRAVASGSTSPEATSNAATLTVNQATPAVSVSASDSNPALGASVTFTATLSGGSSPSGTVTFKDGATTLGTGTISGTTATFATSALTVGSHSVTAVYEGDTNNAAASSSAIIVTVAAPPITVSPVNLSIPTVGVAYSPVTLSASGGTGPYTFTVTGGSLPAGMSLSNVGVLSGTPTAGGAFPPITVTATDANGYTGTRDYTLSVAAPTISISPTSLPDGTVGSSYPTQTLSVSGGTAPYSFEFLGILPDGMTFDTATGEIAGTPTTQSYYTFTVKVTDSSTGTGPYSAQTSVNIDIDMPAIVLLPADGTTLTAGQVGVPYSNTSISATGGSGTMFYEAYDLPPGLTIVEETGEISGTPTEAGSFEWVTVRAGTDMGGLAEAVYVIEIAKAAPTVAVTASDNNPALGASVTFTATLSGATSPTGDVEFFDGSTSLGTGTLSGTTVTLSTSTLTVGAHTITAKYLGDSNNAVATSTGITVTVGQSAPTISVAASDNNPALGASVTFTATLSGGTSPTGDVEFFDGSTSLGTGTLSGITATLSTSALTVGAHTITAKYLGDSNNAVATSTGITVTVTAAPVAFTFAPAAGALTDGTVDAGYSTTVKATGGTGTITYSVSGPLPAGLSLNASTGEISGTPTTAGDYSFTIVATDSATPTANTGSAAYTLKVDPAAVVTFSFSPAAGTLTDATVGTAYSKTVKATGGTGTITYSVSGTLPAGLSLNASTGEISGKPTTAGDYSFTIVATDSATPTANTGSANYTLKVDPAAVTLAFSPSAGTLTDGTVGTAYSKTVTASGGTAPYSYSVTSGELPAGLSLNASTGKITGTPTASGSFSFTVTVTDATGATGTVTYTLKIKSAAVIFVFSPASGSTLANAMVGEDYSQSISAKGGTGTLIYSLASGELPKGVVLNVSTGELTGPLDTDAEDKDYAFTIQVRDGNGSTGTASYTLTVKPREVTVTDKVVNVEAGATPGDVYLNRGATGGPFVSADMTFVEPSNAGTATIIQGELAAAGSVTAPVGWYLQFTPNPAYSGQVRVGFRLTSALGISNTGTITYNIAVDAAKVAAEIDTLVHGFVQSRQNMIANTIKVPGLLERRQMGEATDPVTARMMPSESGTTADFSTSLAQIESARDSADGVPGGYASPFNIWIDGAFLAHNDKDINGGKWGTFALINAGADYLLSDKALLGLSVHYDRMTDPTDEDTELTGNGWMAGPYASFEIGKGVFWNASLRYGGSSNDIDTAFWDGTFDTTRWMADTSVEGQWMLRNDTSITPKLRVLYFSETVEDYEVKNSAGDTIGIDGFDEEQFRVSLGAEIARSFTLESGSKLTPKLGVTGGFSGLDGAGAFGTVTAGLSLQAVDMWMLDASLLLNLDGDGGRSVGGRVKAAKTF